LLFLRQDAQSSLGKLLIGNINDTSASALLALKVFGFYLKKMIVPWPLNFAITEVPSWYLFAGAAGLLFLLLAPKKGSSFLCICIGVLFLFPAIVVAICDVAWTTAAERYLYIPCAFLSIGLAGYLSLLAERLRLQRVAAPLACACIAAAALSTGLRTAVWQSNLALFQDAVAKSPGFGMLHYELAVALAREGLVPEAVKELDLASSLHPSEMLKGMIGKSRLLIDLQQAPPEERRRLLNLYGWKRLQDDPGLLTLLRGTDYQILFTLKDPDERNALISELVRVSERLFAHTGNALLLYNNGQLLLLRGERSNAASFFARSAEAAPEGIYYKSAAKKLAATLGDK
jgi:hypothetical protein